MTNPSSPALITQSIHEKFKLVKTRVIKIPKCLQRIQSFFFLLYLAISKKYSFPFVFMLLHLKSHFLGDLLLHCNFTGLKRVFDRRLFQP